jgi:hypothetical protein
VNASVVVELQHISHTLFHTNQLLNNKVDAMCCISTTTTMNDSYVHTYDT